MMTIERDPARPGHARVSSLAQLGSGDFDRLARELRVTPVRARKTGYVSARLAKEPTRVETRWNGTESTNVAEPGDLICTNMSPSREVLRDADGNANTYVILAHRFLELYERDAGSNEFGDVYRARGLVDAIYLDGGFDICAPWGEKQCADAGYLLRNGADIYGNAKETFEQTYRIIDAQSSSAANR